MPLLAALLTVVMVGQQSPAPAPSSLAQAAAADLIKPPVIPIIQFEIREVTVSSPDWRGRMQPRLQPIAREEAVSAWTVDFEAFRELLSDPKVNIVQAPKMWAKVGDPVRMTNEEKTTYVARVERVSDGPPNEGTQIAFKPETAQVHNGVRVELTNTQLRGSALSAHVLIQQNQLLGFISTGYTESVVQAKTDDAVEKTSLLAKLRPEPDKTAIRATIQIPEVASRRIEGDWLIPSNGFLLVSMGPHSRGGKLGGKSYEERLILLTAVATTEAPPQAQPAGP
ncbi:hypothetical protein [Paludisphaera rhizosphaerae]|uniref:hypothetical protein n=1 Tax=Paludisphaera rhizosphaerae TaxID=2711216 RepID=UPI0013EC27CC|nr:hypothetical protein [Paludisphaera rhizosphaerae]